jgi:oligoribonuclease NrnB/cAMP/cGMP phosphodiesterase (DHH superfamily)
MMHRIIYHMDSDGKAAAAVVAHFLRREGSGDKVVDMTVAPADNQDTAIQQQRGGVQTARFVQ